MSETKKKYKDRIEWTEEEGAEYLDNMETVGRKGLKLKRMNMAFTPANYEYIKCMAQVRGETLTRFVNDVLRISREDNADVYDQAMKFREAIGSKKRAKK